MHTICILNSFQTKAMYEMTFIKNMMSGYHGSRGGVERGTVAQGEGRKIGTNIFSDPN